MVLNATLQYKHKTCSKTGASKFHVLTPEGNNSDVLMAIYDILFDFHFLPDARGFQQNITINITCLLIKTGNRTWIFYTDLMCHCFKHRTHFSRHLYSRGKKNPLSENSINWSTILVVFYFQLTTWQGITVLYFSHCVKKVELRGFFWSAFSCIRTEYGDLFSPNTGKYGPEKTPCLDIFYAVSSTVMYCKSNIIYLK